MLPGKDESAKPCAMIRFGSVDMATWVVENLNGKIPEGLAEPIICRFADAKGKGDAKGGGGGFAPYPGGGGGGAWGGGKGGGAAKGGFEPPPPSDNVWIGDLPVGTQKEDLASIFEAYGQIQDCRMLPGRDETSKPCAMIRFASVEMATWVVENLNGNIPQGLEEAIIARYANSKQGGGKGGGGGWQDGSNAGGWQAGGGASAGWQAGGKAAANSWGAAGKGGKAVAAAAWGGGGGGKGKKRRLSGNLSGTFPIREGSWHTRRRHCA